MEQTKNILTMFVLPMPLKVEKGVLDILYP